MKVLAVGAVQPTEALLEMAVGLGLTVVHCRDQVEAERELLRAGCGYDFVLAEGVGAGDGLMLPGDYLQQLGREQAASLLKTCASLQPESSGKATDDDNPWVLQYHVDRRRRRAG